ncbi:multifunctional tRNA nucleotidyl transferase/2'3'-cyclic phosphodiesterase/2'nucleotidase/phosphatase [Sporotomaculum syntrophicum]|uniref:Multifunctional tRNA nucleotidyl transferase/2'3'-cyclic phosphodiesterase/2'nucleotidase/phosphatase n=1 Tax=Sporotomaculum syntrophicum TaxID=182264 RepID=A0A9D3AY64_9FIRM|nr:HDIG domain-containing metalloprotein [Sporotomaculum syntrophicum]KAF1084448.1 multifunctional tRNA nucleotidyl transferase/2'3'-cyclic phosphodiesterase/2'nucleotidase/phosphatase [Sporotomaculum syntrophicum]
MDKHRLFSEFDTHLLNDDQPSLYFRKLAEAGLLNTAYPFTMLDILQKIKQPPEFHPEGSVWEHTLLVVDMAATRRKNSTNPRVFMWAALLHDLGKANTTKIRRGKITAYDHDKHGAKLAAEFLKEFTTDKEFINQVTCLVRWHMQILYVTKKLPFADIQGMLNEVPLKEIVLFCECDRLGRGNMNDKILEAELANVDSFMQQCRPYMDK